MLKIPKDTPIRFALIKTYSTELLWWFVGLCLFIHNLFIVIHMLCTGRQVVDNL